MWNEGPAVMEAPRPNSVDILSDLMCRRQSLLAEIRAIYQEFEAACKVIKDWDEQKRGER